MSVTFGIIFIITLIKCLYYLVMLCTHNFHPRASMKCFRDHKKRGTSVSMIPGILNKVSISQIQEGTQYAGVAKQTK
jgi:hypothetical protein